MHRPTTLMTLLALGAIALSMPACAQTSPPTSLDYHVSAVPASIRALSWQLLLEDPEGDGAGINEADGQALFYAYDAEADSLWFRFDLYKGFNEERPAMSLSFDLDGEGLDDVLYPFTGMLDRLSNPEAPF